MLRKIELMFSLISNEICYVSMPSVEIIRFLVRNNELRDLKFINSCMLYLDSGDDFPIAWEKSLCEKKNINFMRKKDIELLKSFGNGFGVTDMEGQISLCELYLDTLRLHIREAADEKERFSGPSTILGLLLGIGIIVVFM